MHRRLCRAPPRDDSSYDSSSEYSHTSLSRETSTHTNDSMISSTLSNDMNKCSLNESNGRELCIRLGYPIEDIDRGIKELEDHHQQDEEYIDNLLRWLLNHSKMISLPSSSIQSSNSSNLRSIIIDGSNVAHAYGRNVFSSYGIKECIDYFENRGHTDIIVFIPSHRKELPKSNSSTMNDYNLLMELDTKGYIVWTPSRTIEGRRIICYDDRYILRTAYEKDGVVVSNDGFRDLIREHVNYKFVIEKRLLMYLFVDGKFMPPEDPLGRNGPSLTEFLSKSTINTSQICPYSTKCTYGNKCKYFHPERLHLPFVSLSDRIQRGQHLPTKRAASDSLSIRKHESIIRTNSLDPKTKVKEEHERNPTALPYHMQHNQLIRNKSAPLESPSTSQHPSPSLFSPSTTIWGTPELSVSPISASQICKSERDRLSYHLSHVFPSSSVDIIMKSYPNENDPRVLCQYILQLHKRFESPKSPNSSS